MRRVSDVWLKRGRRAGGSTLAQDEDGLWRIWYEQGKGDGEGVVGRGGDDTRICHNHRDQPQKPTPDPCSDIHLTSTAAKKRLPHRFPNVTAPHTRQHLRHRPIQDASRGSPTSQLYGSDHHGTAPLMHAIGKICKQRRAGKEPVSIA